MKLFSGMVTAIAFALLSLSASPAAAQTTTSKTQTDTLTVYGNCGQCKTRIEEAAYVKGVKTAEWNKKTKLLTVVYNSDKASLDKVAAAIAKAGHDSRLQTAAEIAYKSLPGCCAYRTGTCDHD